MVATVYKHHISWLFCLGGKVLLIDAIGEGNWRHGDGEEVKNNEQCRHIENLPAVDSFIRRRQLRPAITVASRSALR